MSTVPNYNITRVIGSGCFGYVFEAENRRTGKKVALKRVQKVGNQLSRQYEILHMIKQCDNVVKIEDFFYSKNQQGKLIQNIVFQFMDTNLEALLQNTNKSNSTIPLLTVKRYMFQLFNGLKFIHQKNIAHRDLKPENVLLSNSGVIKICDFGSSKVIDSNGKNTPYIVSRFYRAPELILCLTKYTTSIDIWAAGCILAQLILLKPIFMGKTEGDQLFSIFKIMGSFTPQQKQAYKSKVPFDPKLIDSFGQFKKVNFNQLFHKVQKTQLPNLIDLLQKLLCYLHQKRLTAQQALKHPFFDEIRNEQRKSV